jgi:hypothetical protein
VTPNVHSNLSSSTVDCFSVIFKLLETLKYFNTFEDVEITLNVRNRLPGEEEPLLRPRHKWKDNIKMYLKEKELWKIRVYSDIFWRWSSDCI